MAGAAERLGGIQAQEPKPPFVGLWTRLDGFVADHLRAALHEREVVRATMMRGTLHIASARDFLALRPVLQPALNDAMRAIGSRGKGLVLDEVVPVARALLKERPREFDELRRLLSAEFPDVNDRALGYATRMTLPLAMVPSNDRWAFPPKALFTPAEAWLGEPLADPDPEALVLRHLAAFGPAAVADTQTWSGLKGLKPVLERLRDRLEVFEDESGRELFDLPDAPRPDEGVPAPPRFLPEFDNLVLSHQDRTRVLGDEHRPAVVTKNLRVRATFLWDGFVTGTWAVERRKAKAILHLTAFVKVTKTARQELGEEAEALLEFLEQDAPAYDVKFA